jgi:hypothetical protein
MIAYTHRHRNSVSRSTEGGGVALVNNNTVFLDSGCGVSLEDNIADRSVSCVGLGLDAERLVVIHHLVVQDLHIRDSCVRRD